LGLRQHRLRESLKSASPIGNSIRYANITPAYACQSSAEDAE
jgi:hypothetical protein